MRALMQLRRQMQLRRKVAPLPSSIARKNSRDDHLLNWMWLYALILIAALYGVEYLHHNDALPLRMTAELRK